MEKIESIARVLRGQRDPPFSVPDNSGASGDCAQFCAHHQTLLSATESWLRRDKRLEWLWL